MRKYQFKTKDMMKKLFVKFSMLLILLGMSVNAAWGQIDAIIGSIDVEDPTTWFYVNLNASVSNPGCGTTSPGQVWLLHTEAKPTDKLDNEGNWMCLLDENGDPVPDPQISSPDPWSACLHVQDRKAVNPWITSIPRPAQPENPYTAEYVSILRNLWYTGYDAGKADHEADHEKNYPNDESWSAEKKAVVKDGYDIGFAAQNRENPYYSGIEEPNLKTDWNDYFSSGLRAAKDGDPKQEPNWPEWGLPRYLATKIAYNAGYDWYHDWYQEGNPEKGHYLNEATPIGAAKPVGFAPSVSLKGTALVYAPGFEDVDARIAYISTYAYFFGKVQENDGWYFTGWSYTEGESDLGGVVAGSEENDSIMFRVLPSSTNGEAKIRNEYVYATFKPVMVSDYKVNGLINKSVSSTTTVVFDAVGERVSAEDFTVSCSDANFSAAITSCVDDKVIVTVTYSGSADGEFRGNVTLASKSGCSQLTAPVYARVGADATNEATLYDGKTPTEQSGTLLNMIAAANNTDKIVVLNKNYTENLSVNANVTLNFNGYTIQNLTVAGGEITIAYDKYGSNGNAVSVTGGKLILNGGEFVSLNVSNGAVVEQNGATITSAAINNGSLVTTEGRFEGGLTSAGTLTVDGGAFEGETAITVNGGTAILNKAAVSGTETGILVNGGETTISSKLVSVYGGTNAIKQQTAGSIVLQNGKFDGATPLVGTINLQGGYFKTNTPGIDIDGKKVLNVLAGTEYAEGYRYFIGDDATGIGVCRIGTTPYATLEAALAYANNNPTQDVVIIMTNDYTLPAGYYTLPARATLIVPMSDEQETGYEIVNRVSNNSVSSTPYIQPTEFRRLTFAKGVNMDVHGTIELTCTQRASDDGYAAMPHGPYGHLVMEEGSHMTLQSGSLLRAWGFMTGKGETDARRGSKVREQFQMGDWKGGQNSFDMLDLSKNQGRVFPISQYFIQNVESPVKYHPGAILSTTTSVSAANESIGVTAMANDIIIVGVSGGDPAMFFMDQEADAENTWVRKWYNAEDDVQTYDVNTGAHIGSMVLDLGKLGKDPLKMNSGMFVLPITNNMKIHLLSGSMDFTQVTSLLPGAEVEVDKESTVTIYNNPDPEVFSGALIIYDAAEWGNYAKGKGDTGTKYTKVVKYSPSWDGALVAGKPANGKPTVRHEDACPDDASINVHGTFATGDGYLLTTESGANIFSSNEDAGTFICSQNPPSDETLAGLYVLPINNNSAEKKLYLAKLKNGKNHDPQYTETAGAIQGLAFIYRDGAWQMPMIQTANDKIVTYNSNCFTADVSMMTYLAQVCDINPSDDPKEPPMKADVKNTVAIVHAPLRIKEYLLADAFAKAHGFDTGILPHEYECFRTNYYAAVAALGKDKGEAAMMSQMQNSGIPQQEAAASMVPYIPGFKTQAEEYDESYDFGTSVQKLYIKPQEWLEIAGTAHVQLNVDYGTIDEFEESYVDSIKAARNNNYTACDDIVNEYLDYIESQRMNPAIVSVDGNADHTYSDADGAGRLFILMPGCQWWEVEKKDNLYHCIHPKNDTYYYWHEEETVKLDPDDENSMVTIPGYWDEKRFTITWKNWEGTIIQTADAEGNPQDAYSVTYGTMAEFLGTNPTREATIDYTYDFAGWSPALGPVTSDVTYTATFTQKPRMYTIIFQNEGGVEIERQFLTHNEVPVCENVPTKVGHTLEWSPAIAAVTGDATYRAIWHEDPPTEYDVTFFDYDGKTPLQQSKVAVGALPTPPADPTGKATWAEEQGNKEFTYVFDHWAPALEAVSATGAKSYTAVYREEAVTYKVRFFQEDGETQIGDDQKLAYGAVPAIPTAGIIEPGEAGYTYTYVWENMMDNTKTVEAVKANADYKPRFTGEKIKYTVKLKSNPSEACTFTGAGIYNHGDAITISQTAKPNYTFTQWTDENGQVVNALPTTVTADIDLIANFTFEGTGYTITWNNWNGTQLASGSQKENTATTYVGATPTKEDTESTTYIFYGWTAASDSKTYKNGLTPKATKNETYTAYFKDTVRTYTISWKNEAGTADIEVDYEQPYGATIEYNSATPTKNADAEYSYTFDGWSATQGGAVVSLPATVSGDAAFYAHFSKTKVLPTDLILGASGSTDLASADVKKNDLVITSNGIKSSELKGADNLKLTGEAIFRLEKNFAAETWYAVAVPWTVALSGIRDKNGNAFAANYVYVLEFDANAYASADREGGRTDYWHFLDQNGHDMQPGKLYMIWFRNAQTAVEFHKTSGDLWNTETSVTTTTGEGDQANWNAIANPALYHASLNTGAADGDVLKYNGNDSYILGSTSNMIVGEPMFVQVETPNPNVTADIAVAPAPYRRALQETTANNRFVVELTQAGQLNDRMIVQTAEEKVNEYVIGKDLAKMGVSALNAQMWINRYDAKLCKNTVALQGEQVEYPLNISAPAAGEYILSAMQERGNATLYLTRNGEAIWNLSESDYVLLLENGATAEYGLRLSAKAPQVATGIDEAVVDAQGETKKVLINNQVFIIRGEKVYTIDGQMVK